MKQRARYFLLGLCLALAGAGIAATSGGAPSRPTFQSASISGTVVTPGGGCGTNPAIACVATTTNSLYGVAIRGATTSPSYGLSIAAGVNSSTDIPLSVRSRDGLTNLLSVDGTGAVSLTGATTIKAAPGTGQLHVASLATGAANVSFVRFEDSAGTSTGYVGDAGGAESDVYLSCTTSPCNVVLTPSGTGGIMANGQRLPKFVTAQMSVSASSCSVTSSQNMASCARLGTGTFQANFATSFTSAPVCTVVQGPGATGGVQSIGGINPGVSSATMVMLNTANTAIDATTSLQMICIGIG